MKDYELGDLVEVVMDGHTKPLSKGNIGLIVDVKDNVMDGTTYFVRFNDKETFLLYHDEVKKL